MPFLDVWVRDNSNSNVNKPPWFFYLFPDLLQRTTCSSLPWANSKTIFVFKVLTNAKKNPDQM